QITSTRLRCSSSDRNWRDRLEECRPSRSGCVRLSQRDHVLLADQEVPARPAVLEGQASRLCREVQVLRPPPARPGATGTAFSVLTITAGRSRLSSGPFLSWNRLDHGVAAHVFNLLL